MVERFASVSEDELCEKCIIKQLLNCFTFESCLCYYCILNCFTFESCLCYVPHPSASADNTDLGFDNS